jgi:hypothetical protein
VSASHHPTDIHRRQQRKKKRNKLHARISALVQRLRAAASQVPPGTALDATK